MTNRSLAWLVGVTATLFPALADACPVCATREEGGPLGKVALGALIVAPWFAAAGVGWWIRKGLLEEEAINDSLKISGSETQE